MGVGEPAEASDWTNTTTETYYKLSYNATLETSRWEGVPDPNCAWDGQRLSYERQIEDEDGKKRTVKTYKDPFEIIANFKPETKVFGVAGKIEKAATKKFGGSLKGFVWLDGISGGGEVVLPFTAPHIFLATGDRLNPTLTEIHTDPNEDNYYEIVEGKTRVFVKSFSGVGGAAGSPAVLIAHYKMNDDAATAVVVDETGDHDGTYKNASGNLNTDTGASTGKINGAIDCNGTSDYIEIADHDDLTPTTSGFSISAWVYMRDATEFPIAAKSNSTTISEWRLRTSDSDKIYFSFDDSDVSNRIGRYYNTALPENQWIHLVGTHDGGTLSNGINIYMDAVLVDDGDYNAGTFVAVENLTEPVRMGLYSASFANGLIDNVMFFSTELSQDEVNILYNNGSATEIVAELDQQISPRRANLSPLPKRRRYEF